ncbi:GntR family transcriptional regulator [Desemzia sp. RIT804]|uniref:GntR family transcriptional regulator n=1 Tax=Desemzia sp. RIT 804 TaxID=2810209 RepID=UPI0019513422|nr:GntR family transcriptional regulator [Desemzia sp. RIT 804]MBM6614280.1 GntR family transcriptional regulator [Desemzia sp. RIT 804]
MVKYKEVANEIRKRIKSGSYPLEERMPDQTTLANEFHTSRVTIKKALDLLTVAGLVYTIQGSGTYIKQNALQLAESSIRIGQNVGLTAQVDESMNLENKTLKFDVRFPSEEECEQLLLKKEEPVYEIERLRILNNQPYSLEHSILPLTLVPGVTKEVLQQSMYDYIRNELGIVFGENRQTIRAAQPDELDKQYLNCADDEPVLEVSKVMFTSSGTPLEYSKVRHRFDMVEMSFVNLNTEL